MIAGRVHIASIGKTAVRIIPARMAQNLEDRIDETTFYLGLFPSKHMAFYANDFSHKCSHFLFCDSAP